MIIFLAFPLSMVLHECAHLLFHRVIVGKWPTPRLHLSWTNSRFQLGSPEDWRDAPMVDQFFLYMSGPMAGVCTLLLVNHWLWVPVHLFYARRDLKNTWHAWHRRKIERKI